DLGHGDLQVELGEVPAYGQRLQRQGAVGCDGVADAVEELDGAWEGVRGQPVHDHVEPRRAALGPRRLQGGGQQVEGVVHVLQQAERERVDLVQQVAETAVAGGPGAHQDRVQVVADGGLPAGLAALGDGGGQHGVLDAGRAV